MSKSDSIFSYEELLKIGEDILGDWTTHDMIVRGKICGSVRRMLANPKDLELVIEPVWDYATGIKKGQLDIFGNNEIADGEKINLFEYHLEHMLNHTGLQMGNLNGPRYKKFLFSFEDGRVVSIDCFIVLNPASWGLKIFIRTGPGEGFNKPFMTWLRDIRMHVSANRLHSHPKFKDSKTNEGRCPKTNCPLIIPTPTEEDVFKAVGLQYIPPSARCTDSLALAIVARQNRFAIEDREERRKRRELQLSQKTINDEKRWV